MASWADQVEEEERMEHATKVSKESTGNIAEKTSYYVPTKNDIYDALIACKLIRNVNHEDKSPNCDQDKRNSNQRNSIYAMIHESDHNNPRGIECQPASTTHKICRVHTTDCSHAITIAIIYHLTGGNMTEQAMKAINVSEFIALYRRVCRIGHDWCSLYAMYINSCTHIREYNHCCNMNCLIMNNSHINDPALTAHIVDHIHMYKHYYNKFENKQNNRFEFKMRPDNARPSFNQRREFQQFKARTSEPRTRPQYKVKTSEQKTSETNAITFENFVQRTPPSIDDVLNLAH